MDYQPTSGGPTNPYLVEYAKTGRATCQGCKDLIEKGELRLGSPLQIRDCLSYKFRHWSCLTERVLNNMRGKIGWHDIHEAVVGLDELKPQDSELVQRTLQEGIDVLEEDRPPAESAGEEEAPAAKTPRKRASPKKAATARKHKGRAAGEEEEEEEGAEQEEEAELQYKPRPTKRRSKTAAE